MYKNVCTTLKQDVPDVLKVMQLKKALHKS